MIAPKVPKLTREEERAAYEAVTTRDAGRCVRCGLSGPVERDHRQNRDAWNTTPANLQLLGGPFGCGCHLWKTEHPEDAFREGFGVPRWARPELWPAWRFGVGWVLYFDTPVGGEWWREITEATADMLRGGAE
ncbi:hypothetical protein P2P98_08560 [Microbacterium sp. Kw_RZR3]|uniref:hypothetical protein n=1 Tax=Microbacterium sp. Kw_RZR3 TaxID=3032903 RepID=UPI0023DBEBEE|nr:hypothetical protein [Microbacterium sp. Kw_RZR3]MDF2046208.1 hypothetical protein [Microbacterium sp. Kw_RZR3]